jgi:2-keto-4-pentenoate hydratase/2-oxohepta-3-ene-1,7-dioic acid hydratase in catechol pathway
MRLISFYRDQRLTVGVALENDEVIDISRQLGREAVTIRALLASGSEGRRLLDLAVRDATERLALKDLKLAAPIADPQKFLGLGFSYRAHVEEVREKMPQMVFPKYQVWFNKQVSCIVGPYDAIRKPRISDQLDYEGELAVVIGSTCRHVKRERAADVIAGYMVCNDVSVRDWQMRTPTATLGKSFDTHGPVGPWVTLDLSLEEAQNRRLRTLVNGSVRQDGNTNDFIYSIGEMIEELTTVFTLEPGDILATGTPSGVGGMMSPPQFLKVGDVVRVEIEGLGAIENRVIEEPGLSTHD